MSRIRHGEVTECLETGERVVCVILELGNPDVPCTEKCSCYNEIIVLRMSSAAQVTQAEDNIVNICTQR